MSVVRLSRLGKSLPLDDQVERLLLGQAAMAAGARRMRDLSIDHARERASFGAGICGTHLGPAAPALKAPSMRIQQLAACLLAGGVALLSACSKPARPQASAASTASVEVAGARAGPASSRNPCDLLTKADAEAAVGAALPQNSANPALGSCGYTSTDFANGAQLTVGEWGAIRTAATSGAKRPASVGGVGDEALYFTGQETGAGPLYVRHGGQGFLLVLNGTQIDHMPGADALAVEKSLAQKILARM